MGKNNSITVFAPMTGTVVSLDKVPDPVFSGKVLGDGVAIEPTEGKIYAPVDGVVETIAPTIGPIIGISALLLSSFKKVFFAKKLTSYRAFSRTARTVNNANVPVQIFKV